MEFRHIPVLFHETIDNLNIQPDGIYVDGTLGGAGHSHEIASRLTEGGRLIGVDQDMDAIRAATEHLSEFKDRVTIVHNNYENIPEILQQLQIPQVNGILLDLGVSSYQLDNPERGFSYNQDEPLDMRMDQESRISAKTILNTWSQDELTRILREYGEEKCAARIAANIVAEREKKPLETTGELVRIIRASIPMKMQSKGGNPCKRTFQAVRIACNRELDVLQDSIDKFIDLLAPGGRLCIITFQSLEDRIVKNAFRRNENPCTCPPEFPVCVCGKKSKGTVITKKPILPSAEEEKENPRSASAKLRVFEKVRA
jgi:16S rRNA (cytosine1402-N4)-methyltransferase